MVVYNIKDLNEVNLFKFTKISLNAYSGKMMVVNEVSAEAIVLPNFLVSAFEKAVTKYKKEDVLENGLYELEIIRGVSPRGRNFTALQNVVKVSDTIPVSAKVSDEVKTSNKKQ